MNNDSFSTIVGIVVMALYFLNIYYCLNAATRLGRRSDVALLFAILCPFPTFLYYAINSFEAKHKKA